VAVREQLWPVTLRDMRRDDLPTVLDIERRSFSQPWSRAFFEKELATPFARLIVAVEAGRVGPTVVGYTCRWRVTDEVHILNVAVHPDRRGRGFGRLLLEGTLGEARSSRARIVYLEVRAGNVVARRLCHDNLALAQDIAKLTIQAGEHVGGRQPLQADEQLAFDVTGRMVIAVEGGNFLHRLIEVACDFEQMQITCRNKARL